MEAERSTGQAGEAKTTSRNRGQRQKKSQHLSANAVAFTPTAASASEGTAPPQNDSPGRGRGARHASRRGTRRGRGHHSLPQSDRDQVAAAESVNSEAHVSQRESIALVNDVKEAETISERLQQALARNIYECCICCDIIKRHQPVFEDQQCWAVFHLSCISKWAKRALSPEQGAPQDHWRCPACNSQNAQMPGSYACWCTKQLQPEVSRIAPHSCGQTCGKSRGVNCPHPCLLPCHPGPCTPCTSLGPEQRCFCGKNSTQRRCIDTDYDAGSWACQEVCGEILPCDEHHCDKRCHPGLCGACHVLKEATCFCGQQTAQIPCSETEEIEDGVNHDGQPIQGNWQCSGKCGRFFDCREHRCQKPCHTKHDTGLTACPLSPQFITTCRCGQSRVDDILPSPRTKCTDPVPTCGKTCSKPLGCGHQCQSKCHDGPCSKCTVELSVPCQCQSTNVLATCQDMQLGLQPSCDRPCRASLSCSRHICLNKCCSGLPLAQARISKRPKGRHAAQFAARHEELEAEHFCTKSCGKVLSCGNHSCGVVCHAGPCPTCLLASFDDLTCHCGRTAIPAPVACGTKPPECNYPCTRRPICGHPQVSHTCHPDDDGCPRCPYLVERLCMCGKNVVKNQPCWKQNSISCGRICDKPLPCGNHRCPKRCHLPEACEEVCRQACGKPRKGCGHPCQETCHSSSDCPEDSSHPCTAGIMAVCACGNTKMAVRCNSQDPDPNKQVSRALKCTDFCAITERNKKLSSALGVVEERKPVVESVQYEPETLSYYRDNKIWCSTIERDIRLFVMSPDKVKNFKPMKKDLRKFIHEMAEAYGMRSESLDEEPKRSVQVSKTAHSIPPTKSLAQAIATKQLTQPISVPATQVSDSDKPPRRGQAYNAFVLTSLRFGTTEEELTSALCPVLESTILSFEVSISLDGDFAYLKPIAPGTSTETVESELIKLRPAVRSHIATANICESCELCWILKDGTMAYRESDVKRKGLAATNSSSAKKTAGGIGGQDKITGNAFALLSRDASDEFPLPS